MAEQQPSISLTVKHADGSTQVVEFDADEPIMIGSGASSHVRLTGSDISSLHCMLKPKDGKVYVVDLGSDDGTEVNDRELLGETALDDGDIVSVGRARLTVHLGGVVLAPTVPLRQPHSVPLSGTAGGRASGQQQNGHANKDAEATVPMTGTAPHKAAGSSRKVEETKKMTDNTDVARNSKGNGAPPKTATTMPARHEQREKSQTGFRLGSQSDHHAWRKMSEADGHAAQLSPALAETEKPTDKRGVDVTALWGGTVIGVERLSGVGQVTIGDGPDARFQVSHPSIPGPHFPLVSVTAQGAVINVAPGMEATVDGKNASGNVTLEVGQVAKVRIGPVEFVVQYSRRAPTAIVGLSEILDFFYSKILAVALILQMGLVIALMITPLLPGLDDDDLFKNNAEYTKLILTAQEKKKEKKEDLSGKKAARHKDDEGTFGKKDKPKEDKLASKKGAPTVDKDKREEDRKIAMDALAALGLKGPEGAVSNVFGPGGLGSGVNNALGGLKGAAMGDAGGAGGLGSRGTGAGGGGTGLGIGGLGSGTGRGSGGNGNIDLGGRGKGTTRIVPGKIIYEGGLSREEIQRVISRVMSQIKYCYEKELNKDPNLEGKLVAFWVISGSGDVSTVSMQQNTFAGGSAQPVEQCVSRIIQRLKFPSPKGGGIVNVTYPFVFSSSGG